MRFVKSGIYSENDRRIEESKAKILVAFEQLKMLAKCMHCIECIIIFRKTQLIKQHFENDLFLQ